MPQLFKRAWARWKVIAHTIGNFQARLLLSLFYLLIVPVFALVTKLKDPLKLRRHGETSFWRPRSESRSPLDFARKQA
jgi:hypothetical protein